MALLGTFGAADNNGVPGSSVTSGSRTSTSGSLVVGIGACWANPSKDIALSASLAGTYIDAKLVNDSPLHITYLMSYNVGGTRGASHTFTNTPTGSSVCSVGGAEFDGIASSPTVTVGTEATGTSTAPSCSVTVPSGTATVVAVMTYGGSATTITVSNGTEAIEVDENSDSQAIAMAYKTGQSGAVTIAWTLGASQDWSCFAVAFSEPAGGSTQPPRSMHQFRQRR